MLEQLFGPQEITLLTTLAFCLLVGFVIGGEREARGKDAGISTHTLVIMGAMVFGFGFQVIGVMMPLPLR